MAAFATTTTAARTTTASAPALAVSSVQERCAHHVANACAALMDGDEFMDGIELAFAAHDRAEQRQRQRREQRRAERRELTGANDRPTNTRQRRT
jgi:hypothetical protein